MFLKERQGGIVRMVTADGRATVEELARKFDVTPDCIRKDLKALSDQGLIKRVYGGAISVEALPERNVRKRVERNAAEKRAIAEKSFEQIRDGEVVFLDISTTNLALARIIAASTKRMTVVSNMIDILQALATNDRVTSIGTGGTIEMEQNAFLGAFALSFIEPMRFDKAFLGTSGIDPQTGDVLTFDVDDGLLKRLAVKNAAHAYLMADVHKFSGEGSYVYATLSDFDAVITDAADAGINAVLRGAGVTRI